jgi:hypothetical protein
MVLSMPKSCNTGMINSNSNSVVTSFVHRLVNIAIMYITIYSSVPICPKITTPEANTIKQPISESSAAEGFLNCLPQA